MEIIKKSVMAMTLLCLAAGIGEAKKKSTGEDISNMIIEGENRLQVHGQIPELSWNVDAYRDVPEALRDYVLLGELKSPSINQPPLTLPSKSTLQKTATPWLHDIYEAPILTLNFKSETQVLKPKWVFVVKDSHGKPFYEINKASKLPEQIVWDGVGSNGKPLHVGFDYSYLMTIIDEAGNPKRFAGKPFRLNSFRFEKGGKVVTMLNPNSIFTERSSLRFSDIGRTTMIEIKDFLRNRYGGKIEIVSYDDDAKFGLSRAKIIRDFLVSSLDIPADKVTAQGLSISQGDGYKHVDIVAK